MRVGVLALQGDFAAHERALSRIDITGVEVRLPQDVADLDGLILPGGESTTLIRLMTVYGMVKGVQEFHDRGGCLFGTCAGSILLASDIQNSEQFRFGFLDMTVERNGYGRQVHSFEADVPVTGESAPLHAIFIRAPKILSVGPNVNVLAEWDGHPVAARTEQILVTTFHPELTDDVRMHRIFADMIKKGLTK